jgi:septal ring factor EnvC (AmiA/AmiB activator)
MEKMLSDEMSTKDRVSVNPAIDELLIELKRELDKIRVISERMAKEQAEIERIKQETREIDAETDAFINLHTGEWFRTA